MIKTDTELHSDVVDELSSDPSLDASRIAIAAHDGVVTLSGAVRSYWQKIEAENAVKRVTGVRGVANDLKVELLSEHRRDDTDIAEAAADTLEWHSELPKTIEVSVSNGWITLSGSVDWQYEKEEAEVAVKYLSGVKGVINTLTIKSAPKVDDVRERIRKELERTIDQEANRIMIETSNGRVTLRGSVHSWPELDAARRAAWSVPGVKEVDNELVIA
ncbi:MAG TPA: BON domain-containing protein [Candidatus Cybelea sp.]|jgi:osmotically-inducible protein OsmY